MRVNCILLFESIQSTLRSKIHMLLLYNGFLLYIFFLVTAIIYDRYEFSNTKKCVKRLTFNTTGMQESDKRMYLKSLIVNNNIFNNIIVSK